MSEQVKTETVSAESFKNESGSYVFPFEALDRTPGGSNLGRIEWHVEIGKGKKTRGRYYIERMLVWATQTRDHRYAGILFEIPCFSEMLHADSVGSNDSYLKHVWSVGFCNEHKLPYFSAYPENRHNKLVIEANSSIMVDMYFEESV